MRVFSKNWLPARYDAAVDYFWSFLGSMNVDRDRPDYREAVLGIVAHRNDYAVYERAVYEDSDEFETVPPTSVDAEMPVPSLLDIILAWLTYGGGINEIASYPQLLQTVLSITVHWHHGDGATIEGHPLWVTTDENGTEQEVKVPFSSFEPVPSFAYDDGAIHHPMLRKDYFLQLKEAVQWQRYNEVRQDLSAIRHKLGISER